MALWLLNHAWVFPLWVTAAAAAGAVLGWALSGIRRPAQARYRPRHHGPEPAVYTPLGRMAFDPEPARWGRPRTFAPGERTGPAAETVPVFTSPAARVAFRRAQDEHAAAFARRLAPLPAPVPVVAPTAILAPLPHPDSEAAERLHRGGGLAAALEERSAANARAACADMLAGLAGALPEGWPK